MRSIFITTFAILFWTAALAFSHDQESKTEPTKAVPTKADRARKHLIVAAEESDSSVGIYDSESGASLASIRVGKWPHEIVVSPDGKKAYVTNFGLKDYDSRIGHPGASISIIDLVNMAEVGRLYTFRDANEYDKFRAPHGVKISRDGTMLFVNTEWPSDYLLVYDLTDPDVKFPCKHIKAPKGMHSFLLSNDGHSLWAVSGREGVMRLDLTTWNWTGVKFNPEDSVIRGLTYSVGGRYLIAAANERILLLDPDTLHVRKEFAIPYVKQFLYAAATPDGKWIVAPAVWEGLVIIIDTESGNVVRRLIVGADPIHVVPAQDGTAVYVSHGRSKFISEIDLMRLEERRRIPTRGGPNGLAVAPYGAPPVRKTLLFGAVLPLTGDDAPSGNDLMLGYQHWAETVNDAGGLVINGVPYQVEMLYRDSRSEKDLKLVADLTTELIQKDRVSFLLGGYPSGPHFAIAEVADRFHIPLVTASGAAEAIYTRGYRHVFGVMSPARGFLNGTIELALEQDPKPSTVAFLTCDDPAAVQDAITTAHFAQAKSLRVVAPKNSRLKIEPPGVLVFQHAKGGTDLEDYVEALKELDADLIAVTGHIQESIAFVKAAQAAGLRPKAFLFSVGPSVPLFVRQLGGLAEHMMGAAMWSPEQIGLGHDRFLTPAAYRAAFFERFVKEPSHLAAGAMACGLVYEEAFRKAKSADPAAVRQALTKVDMETFYSRIRFDDRGLNDERPMITIQLRASGGGMRQTPLWPPVVAGRNRVVWPFVWGEK